MTLQRNQGWLCGLNYGSKCPLTHSFSFAERDDTLTNTLPWLQVASNNIQVKGREYSPERSQIALPTFEQSNGGDSNPSLLGKIALGQFSVLPLSLQVNSQRRVMQRKFEHFRVRERENSKKV